MNRTQTPRVRLLAGFCLFLFLGAIPAASGSPSALPVRTLLEVRGAIEGFAQDGRYITWANPTPVYGQIGVKRLRACTRIVQLRDLRTKKTWPLVSKKSSLCEEFGTMDGFQHRMALAGTRALWGLVTRATRVFTSRCTRRAEGSAVTSARPRCRWMEGSEGEAVPARAGRGRREFARLRAYRGYRGTDAERSCARGPHGRRACFRRLSTRLPSPSKQVGRCSPAGFSRVARATQSELVSERGADRFRKRVGGRRAPTRDSCRSCERTARAYAFCPSARGSDDP